MNDWLFDSDDIVDLLMWRAAINAMESATHEKRLRECCLEHIRYLEEAEKALADLNGSLPR